MRLAFLLFAVVGFLQSARAHNAPGSAVLLDLREDRVLAELWLPVSELEISFAEPLSAAPSEIVSRHGDALSAYVVRHVHPKTPDGRGWKVEVKTISVATEQQSIDVVVALSMRPPAGASVQAFTLNYDLIGHEVINHIAHISLRSDARKNEVFDPPRLLGVIRFGVPFVAIERPQ